jgi:hypothetical protein
MSQRCRHVALAPSPDVFDARPAHAPLQQSAAWIGALRLLGADIRPLRSLGLSGHAVLRRFPGLGPAAMISRGVPGLDKGQAAALRKALGVRHLVVHAETAGDGDTLAQAGYRRIAAPRQIAELEVGRRAGALAAAMSGKWRNRLRHALRQNLSVRRRTLPPDPRHWLFAAEAGAARRLGYVPLPPALVAAVCASDPGAGQLFTVTRGGEVVAAMLFLRHGATATYQVGWTSPAGRAASAGNLCLWRAMLELRELGVGRIDLGAADLQAAPALVRFKTGAGGVVRSLGGSWLDTAWLPRRQSGRRRAHRFSPARPPVPALR